MARKSKLNPRGNDDVQRGIDAQQRRMADRTKHIPPKDPKYYVKKSHQTT